MRQAISKAIQWSKRPMTTLQSKDISDWVKIVVMIGVGFMAYQHLVDRVDVAIEMGKATVRIERYLSSKDPQYWMTVKKLSGDEAPAR
jgi:hypothetical protein